MTTTMVESGVDLTNGSMELVMVSPDFSAMWTNHRRDGGPYYAVLNNTIHDHGVVVCRDDDPRHAGMWAVSNNSRYFHEDVFEAINDGHHYGWTIPLRYLTVVEEQYVRQEPVPLRTEEFRVGSIARGTRASSTSPAWVITAGPDERGRWQIEYENQTQLTWRTDEFFGGPGNEYVLYRSWRDLPAEDQNNIDNPYLAFAVARSKAVLGDTEPVPVVVHTVNPFDPDEDYSAQSWEYTETLEQYQQKFRQVTYGTAHRAGVSIPPIDVAMRRLNVADPALAPGAWLHHYYAPRLDVPEGTVIRLEHGEGVTLQGWAGPSQGWIRLAGQAQNQVTAGRIVSIGDDYDVPDWVTREGPEEADIREFQRRAWDLGVAAKAAQGWCGDYERAMEEMGVNGRTIETLNEPTLDPEAVSQLPEGTILRTVETLFVRDDRVSNPCRTRRIGGRSKAGHWSSEMRLAQQAGADLRILVVSTHEMAGMPVGTVVEDRPGAIQYRLNDQQKWARVGHTAYAYEPRDVLQSGYTAFVAFPEGMLP